MKVGLHAWGCVAETTQDAPILSGLCLCRVKHLIVITGASSGFGALTARTLAPAGHTVYASMRDISGVIETVKTHNARQ